MYRSLSLSLSGVTVRSRPMRTPQRIQITLQCKSIARTAEMPWQSICVSLCKIYLHAMYGYIYQSISIKSDQSTHIKLYEYQDFQHLLPDPP